MRAQTLALSASVVDYHNNDILIALERCLRLLLLLVLRLRYAAAAVVVVVMGSAK